MNFKGIMLGEVAQQRMVPCCAMSRMWHSGISKTRRIKHRSVVLRVKGGGALTPKGRPGEHFPGDRTAPNPDGDDSYRNVCIC